MPPPRRDTQNDLAININPRFGAVPAESGKPDDSSMLNPYSFARLAGHAVALLRLPGKQVRP
jgi:hypothetical protein